MSKQCQNNSHCFHYWSLISGHHHTTARIITSCLFTSKACGNCGHSNDMLAITSMLSENIRKPVHHCLLKLRQRAIGSYAETSGLFIFEEMVMYTVFTVS